MARLLLLKDLTSVKSISSLLTSIPAGKQPLLIKPNYSQDWFTDTSVDSRVFRIVNHIYSASESICPDTDTRVLLPNAEVPSLIDYFTDCNELAQKHNGAFVNTENIGEFEFPSTSTTPRHDSTCLGGTFDRMHVAHKILISEALLIARNRTVIGVATGALLEKKFLRELIQPIDERVKYIESFINSIQSHLDAVEVVGINEPAGPAGTDPELSCIVVSEEVVNAVPMINEGRERRGLRHLSYHVHNDGDMMTSAHKDASEQITSDVSSSAGRARLLGTLLRPPRMRQSSVAPYVIGLNGPIASGKTSVARRLENMGAYRLDADQLGHLAYVPLTEDHPEGPAYSAVLEHFGSDILSDDSAFIDRRKLGAKVFAVPEERKKLEQLVWPAIQQLAEEKVKEAHLNGFKIVVLEAAVLLEAGWQSFVNEVWTTYVPVEESVKRCMERDGKSEDVVRKIISAQIDLQSRVNESNVVISTVWDPTVTSQYCEKAWALLQNRLQ